MTTVVDCWLPPSAGVSDKPIRPAMQVGFRWPQAASCGFSHRGGRRTTALLIDLDDLARFSLSRQIFHQQSGNLLMQ